MKSKDFAVIGIVVFVTGLLSFFISGKIFGTNNKSTQVEVVEVIKADFPEPNKKYFNPNSIDPTQLIKIGDSPNPQPFNKK